MLYVSLVLNLVIAGCEIWTLGKIKKKRNILKYYTFLQNFFALVVSVILSVSLVVAFSRRGTVPEFARGLRYIATCGLMATMFIYVVVLKNRGILMTEEDFMPGLSPQTANFVLHYFCPAVSLISFVLFERQIVFTASEWTGYAAIPSCLYWVIYIILSAAHLWEEPYDFMTPSREEKKTLAEVVTAISIPLSYILISYILWKIK